MFQFSGLLLLVSVCSSEAAQGLMPQRPQPGKTPYCVDSEVGKKKVGEEWSGICYKKYCYANTSGAVFIQISGCGLVSETENCKLVTRPEAKSWPECCPVLECGPTDKEKE